METDKKSQASKITKDYLQNRYSKETEEDIQQWLIEDENSEEKEKASLEYWDTLAVKPNAKTYRVLKRVNAKIGFIKIIPLHRRLMRIAAVLIPAFILLGSIYYFSQQDKMVQVIAAYGETKHILLPDSSEVWLNAGSSLHYPSTFKKESRSLTLEGEAYFSVRKNEQKPFVVNTQNLLVKVLGTKFNVKAYSSDHRTIATLTTGKVEVKTNSNQTRILEPDEQLTFDSQTAAIQVTKVSAHDIASWTTGQLIFSGATLNEIFQTLERRFDISFDTSKAAYQPKESYTIKFLKDDSIEQILNILKDVTGDFSYTKTGNKILITPNM
jgi:ferric-dicitrate binding protein FerR (iron transport regulator)